MTWSNWKAEDIGIKVKGAPAVSSWKEGRLDVFVCSTTNHLYHRVYENDKWQGVGWVDLSNGHKIEVSPSAVSWGPNRTDLFAVWGKQLHHRACINGAWSAWAENLEGATNDAPAAASWKTERVDVLVHTTDNFMSRRYWENGKIFENGNGWKGWETVGGQMKPLKSAPAAVSSGAGRIDCFARGAADRLIHASYQDGKQADWTEIDTLAINDAPAAVSASTADKGRIDVFVRGVDNLLKKRVYYHKGWEAGKTWENISANKIFSAPAAVAWWNLNVLKRVDCFAQGPGNNLIHTWWKETDFSAGGRGAPFQSALPVHTCPSTDKGGPAPTQETPMKVEITETFKFPPEIIFAVITDIPHHADWVAEPVELVSLSDGPAKLGTTWEQNADRLGKKLVTLNICNIYEKNRKFGWKSERPFPSQVTFLLDASQDLTKLKWIVESEETGIVQLAEPLLIKQADEMIKKSMGRLKAYIMTKL